MSQAIDEAIQKVIGAVETVAPKAWQMMVNAQRLEASISLMQEGIATIATLAALGTAWWFIGRAFPVEEMCDRKDYYAEDRFGFRLVSSLVAALILVIIAVNVAGDAARYRHADVLAARELAARACR